VRIGQSALERVVLALECFRELRERYLEHLDAARIVLSERLAAPDNVKRSLAFRSCLGEQQSTVVEIERKQTDLSGNLGALVLPPEPAGDHEVEHEEQFVLGLEHDTFSSTMQVDNGPTLQRRQRRVNRSQQKGRHQTDPLDGVTDDPRPQCVEVQQDVRQLRHTRVIG
jgi:hypothetical protein